MSSSSITATAPAPPTTVAPNGIFANSWVRAVVSLVLVYHLIAVLIEPLSIPPRFEGTPSTLPNAVRPAFQPYMTALSLEQGYRFFAPDPGDSHLIRYDLYFADGTKSVGVAEQGFPNSRRDWPRLLYHRYFMLAEHLPTTGRFFGNWDAQDPPPAALDAPQAPLGAASPLGEAVPPIGEFVPPIADDAPRVKVGDEAEPADRRSPAERLQAAYLNGFAAYLAKKHNAERVDIFHVVHRLSHPQEIIEGRKLDTPDTYRERMVLSYKMIKAKPAKTGAAPSREVLR